MVKKGRVGSREGFRDRTGFRFPMALAFMIAYWCALILLDAAADGFNIRYNGWELSPSVLWLDRAVWFGTWIAVTPLILMILGSGYPGRHGRGRTLAFHLLAHPLIISLQVGLAASAFVLMSPNPVESIPQEGLRLFLTVTLGRDLHAYAALVAIFYAASWWKRRADAEIRASRLAAETAEMSRRLTDAKLESLRRELNPHVLFNALNSIGTLVRSGEGARAIRMLSSMSSLLRAYLVPSRDEVVPLQEELDLLDRYVDMVRIRLEERLAVRVTIEPDARGAAVPPLLLQPILENAIKHGADQTTGRTRVSVNVAREGTKLRIEIVNQSQPPPGSRAQAGNEAAGVGLPNLRRRLAVLFGPDAGVRLEPREGGASVTIWMPYVAAEEKSRAGARRSIMEGA